MAGSRRGGDEEACRVDLLDGGAKKDDWPAVDGGGEASSKLGRRVLEESKKLWVIVAPAMFSRIVTFSMNVITQAFAGHLGDLELAAISIANTVVVGFSFGLMNKFAGRGFSLALVPHIHSHEHEDLARLVGSNSNRQNRNGEVSFSGVHYHSQKATRTIERYRSRCEKPPDPVAESEGRSSRFLASLSPLVDTLHSPGSFVSTA